MECLHYCFSTVVCIISRLKITQDFQDFFLLDFHLPNYGAPAIWATWAVQLFLLPLWTEKMWSLVVFCDWTSLQHVGQMWAADSLVKVPARLACGGSPLSMKATDSGSRWSWRGTAGRKTGKKAMVNSTYETRCSSLQNVLISHSVFTIC